jgi:hypothetical protein
MRRQGQMNAVTTHRDETKMLLKVSKNASASASVAVLFGLAMALPAAAPYALACDKMKSEVNASAIDRDGAMTLAQADKDMDDAAGATEAGEGAATPDDAAADEEAAAADEAAGAGAAEEGSPADDGAAADAPPADGAAQ